MHFNTPPAFRRLATISFFFLSLMACENIEQSINAIIYDRPAGDFTTCEPADSLGFQTITEVSGTETVRYYLKTNPAAIATVIHFHGNADSACYALSHNPTAVDPLGRFNLVYAEYPGYVGDATTPNETVLLSNAEGVYQAIAAQFAQPIILTGHSLGANIATWIASNWPVDGIVLISSFPDMKVLADILFPGVEIDLGFNLYNASDWAPFVSNPVLAIAPQNDLIVPVFVQQTLWADFTLSSQGLFKIIENEDHNSVLYADALYAEINAFLDSIL